MNVLELQAALLVFLGGVVLLAHTTTQARDVNTGARWFFLANLCGGAGLLLESQRGNWTPWLSVIAGNFLFMLLAVFLTRSVERAVNVGSRTMPFLVAVAVASTLALSYYTFPHPDTVARVVVASIAMPLLLLPSVALLLRSRQEAVRAATRTMAAIMIFFIAGCVLGIAGIMRGARPTTGARWTGALLIAGIALCFLWMDMLRMRAELEQQAMTDPLTGLLNRRAIEMLGSREMARAARQGSAVTLLTVDIDHFKSINDSFGHSIGDAALMGVADVLRNCTRKQDLCVRTGGDEFTVLLTESTPQIAELMQRRITRQVDDLGLRTYDGRPFAMSVTVGVFTAMADKPHTYQDLVHASDMDLYLRKQRRTRGDETSGAAHAEKLAAR